MTEEIQRRTITMLQAQRDALQAQNDAMRAFIKTVPGLITEARLDAKQGKETKLNYSLIAELCKISISEKRCPMCKNILSEAGLCVTVLCPGENLE
jgi:hypothetical protein